MNRVGSFAALLLVPALLAGCVLSSPYQNVPSDGGTPADEVIATLESIPGIARADYRAEPWDSPGEGGLFASSGMDFVLVIEVDPGYHVVDLPGFLTSAFRTAWSVNDGFSPKGDVRLVLDGGVDIDHDWSDDVAAAFDISGAPRIEGDGPATTVLDVGDGPPVALGEREIVLYDERVREAFGDWPAVAPDDLGDFIAEGAPEGVELPAIESPRLYLSTDTGCWIAAWDEVHSRELGAEYSGPISGTLAVDGVDRGTESREAGDTAPGLRFCGDDLPTTGESLTLSLDTPAVDGFLATRLDGIVAADR